MRPVNSVSCVVLVLLAAGGCHPPGWDRDPSVDAAAVDSTAIDAAASVDAGDAAAACARSFRLEGHGTAAEALLTGDFVTWAGTGAAGALAMTLGQDAAWTVQRTFEPGTYQYRFIVDGTWMADPANPNMVPNGLGGFNSVVSCP